MTDAKDIPATLNSFNSEHARPPICGRCAHDSDKLLIKHRSSPRLLAFAGIQVEGRNLVRQIYATDTRTHTPIRIRTTGVREKASETNNQLAEKERLTILSVVWLVYLYQTDEFSF